MEGDDIVIHDSPLSESVDGRARATWETGKLIQHVLRFLQLLCENHNLELQVSGAEYRAASLASLICYGLSFSSYNDGNAWGLFFYHEPDVSFFF